MTVEKIRNNCKNLDYMLKDQIMMLIWAQTITEKKIFEGRKYDILSEVDKKQLINLNLALESIIPQGTPQKRYLKLMINFFVNLLQISSKQ